MRRLRTGFTTRASCLLAAGLTALVCGLVLGEVDLLRAGILAAVVPCVAAVVVQRTQVRISSRRAVSLTRVRAGESVTMTLTITNGSPLPTGSLMLEDQLPAQLSGNARFVLDSLASREAREVAYRIPHLDRGHYRIGPLRLRLTDPFGMVDLTRSFTAVSEFVATPTVDRLPAAAIPRADDRGNSGGSHSIGTHGADDASTREYRTGDDLRKIHWRSTARTGSLMVRQEERPSRGAMTLLLDLRRDGHDHVPADFPEIRDDGGPVDPRLRSSIEWAISAAASVGTHVLTAGQRFSLFSDPDARDVQRFEDPDQLATRLALAHPRTGVNLARLVARARDHNGETSLVAILGRLDQAGLERLAAVPRRRGTAAMCVMLLDVESWAEPAGTAGPAEAGYPGAPQHSGPQHAGPQHSGPQHAGPQHAAATLPVAAAAAVLRNAGWRVVIVRRGDTTASAWSLLLAGSAPALAGVTR